ncbi:hypothetical protein DFH29DRAFT_529330 [Suillus ampliporus]|nr:hypothetical protein DFH29DRAFT_529330 [Suillus ampliporus]
MRAFGFLVFPIVLVVRSLHCVFSLFLLGLRYVWGGGWLLFLGRGVPGGPGRSGVRQVHECLYPGPLLIQVFPDGRGSLVGICDHSR